MGRSAHRWLAGLVALTAAVALSGSATGSAPQVLRVGSWHGITGNEPSLDAAMAALRPGGWLLIGPGDWHPRMDYQAAQRGTDFPSALLVTQAGVHLRGMNRNSVILDGTKPGSKPCSSAPADQDYGAVVNGKPQGRNGPEALKTDAVYFENFTACNFLTGTSDSGNEIWWNGGDDGGHIGLGAWWGRYLSATSTFFDPAHAGTAAQYGIFISNSRGPGFVDYAYASNMNDSSFYIGACPDCNGALNHVHAENSALGLSSTNAGGHLVIENSEWDDNKTGLVSNSQNGADPPTPQDGTCPGGGTGPLGTTSCTLWRNNYVHDNNNPNVPTAGTAGLGPIGTGMVLAGTRNNTIVGNRIEHNNTWGVLTTFFPDTDPGNANNISDCHGGTSGTPVPGLPGVPDVCVFDGFGNHVVNNAFAHNGSYGNPTNGDIADLSYGPPPESPGAGADCYAGNTDPGGLSTSPTLLETVQTDCTNPATFPNIYSPPEYLVLGAQAICATGFEGPCPSGTVASYPQATTVRLLPMPAQQTMPDPCQGVPANPWCPAAKTVATGSHHPGGRPLASTGALAVPVVLIGGLLLALSTRRRRAV